MEESIRERESRSVTAASQVLRGMNLKPVSCSILPIVLPRHHLCTSSPVPRRATRPFQTIESLPTHTHTHILSKPPISLYIYTSLPLSTPLPSNVLQPLPSAVNPRGAFFFFFNCDLYPSTLSSSPSRGELSRTLRCTVPFTETLHTQPVKAVSQGRFGGRMRRGGGRRGQERGGPTGEREEKGTSGSVTCIITL